MGEKFDNRVRNLSTTTQLSHWLCPATSEIWTGLNFDGLSVVAIQQNMVCTSNIVINKWHFCVAVTSSYLYQDFWIEELWEWDPALFKSASETFTSFFNVFCCSLPVCKMQPCHSSSWIRSTQHYVHSDGHGHCSCSVFWFRVFLGLSISISSLACSQFVAVCWSAAASTALWRILVDMVEIERNVDRSGRSKKEPIHVSYNRGLITELIGNMMLEKSGYHIVASTAPPKWKKHTKVKGIQQRKSVNIIALTLACNFRFRLTNSLFWVAPRDLDELAVFMWMMM